MFNQDMIRMFEQSKSLVINSSFCGMVSGDKSKDVSAIKSHVRVSSKLSKFYVNVFDNLEELVRMYDVIMYEMIAMVYGFDLRKPESAM